jgi:hypothetical protein
MLGPEVGIEDKMKRFILITFAFLAWGFYELSGGNEFEPMRASVEASTPVAQTELPAAPVAEVTEAPAETETFVDTDPPVVAETTQAETVVAETVVIATAEEAVPENVDVPLSDGTVTSSQDTPAIIPSLIVGDTTQQAEPATPEVYTGDVRRVSGSRVNVRGGPGTDFGVVTRLLRGDEVEVILDNGDGWVKMRPIDGGPEGWMADFLLTSG